MGGRGATSKRESGWQGCNISEKVGGRGATSKRAWVAGVGGATSKREWVSRMQHLRENGRKRLWPTVLDSRVSFECYFV